MNTDAGEWNEASKDPQSEEQLPSVGPAWNYKGISG